MPKLITKKFFQYDKESDQFHSTTYQIQYHTDYQRLEIEWKTSPGTKETKELTPIPEFYKTWVEETNQILARIPQHNSLHFQDQEEWSSTKIDQLHNTNMRSFQQLDLRDITHLRRYGPKALFEFLCVWRNSSQQEIRTWQRYFIIKSHPRFTQYVPITVWDRVQIVEEFNEQYYKTYHNSNPEKKEWGQISSSLPETPIYCVYPIRQTPSS